MNYNYEEYLKEQRIQLELMRSIMDSMAKDDYIEFKINHPLYCDYFVQLTYKSIDIEVEYYTSFEFLVKEDYHCDYDLLLYYIDNNIKVDFMKNDYFTKFVNFINTEDLQTIYKHTKYVNRRNELLKQLDKIIDINWKYGLKCFKVFNFEYTCQSNSELEYFRNEWLRKILFQLYG